VTQDWTATDLKHRSDKTCFVFGTDVTVLDARVSLSDRRDEPCIAAGNLIKWMEIEITDL